MEAKALELTKARLAEIKPGINYPRSVRIKEVVKGETLDVRFVLQSYEVGMYCAIYTPDNSIPAQVGDHNNKTFVGKLVKDITKAIARGADVEISSLDYVKGYTPPPVPAPAEEEAALAEAEALSRRKAAERTTPDLFLPWLLVYLEPVYLTKMRNAAKAAGYMVVKTTQNESRRALRNFKVQAHEADFRDTMRRAGVTGENYLIEQVR